MTFKYVHILCISGIYLCISRLYLFICLYSALLGGLRPPGLNKIYTFINDMNKYEQTCLCSYQLLFLQFMLSDGSAKMHLAFICRRYLCISVNICLYLGISVFIISAYVCIDSSHPKSGSVWPASVPVWIGGPPLRSALPITGSS